MPVNISYDVAGRNSGDTILISTMPASVTLAYDNLGNRTSLTRGNGTVTSYAYDPATRLTSFTHDLSGTAQDGKHPPEAVWRG